MHARVFLIHCLSPLHAGAGQEGGIIDLPIARMRSTGIPILPGSSIKGVLREQACVAARGKPDAQSHVSAVFGPDSDAADKHAGALVLGDARLVALPVRSFRGVFAWATCPLLLQLAARDLQAALVDPPGLPDPADGALCHPRTPLMHPRAAYTSGEGPASRSEEMRDGMIYLEELDLRARTEPLVARWAQLLTRRLDAEQLLGWRLTVIPDDAMAFLWETATQVDTRVRIDQTSGTVAEGALWLEESLPPDTLLIGLAAADRSRDGSKLNGREVADIALGTAGGPQLTLQLGGNASVGRGRAALVSLAEEGQDD
jgi:CRISPR-associated protein Cmr4